MSEKQRQLRVRGVRGTIPTTHPSTLGYGGNTCCLDVSLASNRRLLLDCGTGLRSIEAELPARAGPDGLHFDVLLTHYHSDHLIGLPFFKPLYDPGSHFTFYGPSWRDRGVRSLLERAIGPPWFPIPLRDTPSGKSYVDLGDDPITLADLRVSHTRLNHPQGCTAFRLDGPARAIVFATDHERGDPEADSRLLRLSDSADVLIHDAQYTPADYEDHRGWGHSTWKHAVEAAAEARVRRVLLFHHDPDRRDEELDVIVEQASRVFAEVSAAREGEALIL